MATGNMKSIKRRIKSVSSTRQITKAMELVASSKQRKAKQRAEAVRPYFEAQYEILTEIAAENDSFESVFTKKRDTVKNKLYIVIAGDKGLAGGHNSNIFKLVSAAQGDDKNLPKIIAIGKKSVEYYTKHGYEVVGSYPGFAENVKVGHCSDIVNTAVEMYRKGEVDEVRIFYTGFVSMLSQTPSEMQLLPIDAIRSKTGGAVQLTTYDPSPEAVFDRVVPKFLVSIIHCACTESYASEQSARRMAMESASDNAEQMIESLSLLYNRARQEKITNELTEIVSGANAI